MAFEKRIDDPALPAANAAQVTLATLAGLALALLPGQLAAKRPAELLSLAADGLALTLILTLLIGLERMDGWSASTRTWVLVIMAAGLGFAGLLLLGVTGLRSWRGRAAPGAGAVFLAGLCVAYLLLPLLHHVAFTDGYAYISDSDNFFARGLSLQIVAWSVAAAAALGVTQLRRTCCKLGVNPSGRGPAWSYMLGYFQRSGNGDNTPGRP